MKELQALLGQLISLELSGNIIFTGKLVDYGPDILVISSRANYLYIPISHVHFITRALDEEEDGADPQNQSAPLSLLGDSISYRKMLVHAKGIFVEIFVSGNQSIHGYITAIMNDFVEFYSPVFRTLYISMDHIKYLIPNLTNRTPYSLSNDHYPVKPSNLTLARTFEQQVNKLIGKFVVFDLVQNPQKIGLLKSMNQQLLELTTANGETYYWSLKHIKTVHHPDG